MRRALPWALLGVLGAGTGLGAWLGTTPTPTPRLTPAAWVAHLLATTADAGSARFTYTHVTASANPEERAMLNGRGEVDFRSGNVSVTEVDRQDTFTTVPLGVAHGAPTTSIVREIGIGPDEYQNMPPDGPAPSWIKLPWKRERRGDLGLASAANAAVALDMLTGPAPVDSVRDLGAATLEGERTTRYLVSTAKPTTCPGARRSPLVATQGPSLVWVDARGRLVQVENSLHESGHLPATILAKIPAFARLPMSPSTTTATLHFSDFGAPVQITAPPARSIITLSAGSSSSFGVALRSCSGRRPRT
jgi:hypothetical protein